MEIFSKLLDTVNDLSMGLKATILIALMIAFLAFTYITKEEPAPEVAPTTVTKTVELGEVKDTQGSINISQ